MSTVGASVLVIDNNRLSRMVLEDELRAVGCQVSLADTAAQGLELALSLSPDLITLDLGLEDMSGVDLIDRLKNSDKTSGIPFVVVTGVEDPIQRELCMRAGALGVMYKPFGNGSLGGLVKSHLKQIKRRTGRRILVVERSSTIRAITRHLLEKQRHTVIECTDGLQGWNILADRPHDIDMIVTDINMPNMDGQALIEKIRGDERFQFIPIIVSSTIVEKDHVSLLLDLGADDYIVKPFSTEEFSARIQSHLRVKSLFEDLRRANMDLSSFNDTLERRVEERTFELKNANLGAIFSLATAAEAKDFDTGNHLKRIERYSEALALKIGLTRGEAVEIGYSSIMHDVGKISVPDSILKKPGKLTPEEFDVMKNHSSEGEKILPDKPFFAVARRIARGHHEKWNGKGYPDGLSKHDIPLPARIVALADVFDALTSSRSYKDAWSMDAAMNEIKKSAGAHFDPALVDAWVDLFDEGVITAIYTEWK